MKTRKEKWGKIGSPNSQKRKEWMKKIQKERGKSRLKVGDLKMRPISKKAILIRLIKEASKDEINYIYKVLMKHSMMAS